MEALYPQIRTQEETQLMIDGALNKSRIDELNTQKHILEKDAKRYKKLLNRWKNIDISLKVIGSGVVVIGGTVSAVCSVITMPIFVPIVIGAISATDTAVLGSISLGLINKKKKRFNEKCKIVQSHLDKMYYFLLKAKSDGVITYDEMQEFKKLIDDYNKEISGSSEDFDIEKIKREAEKQVNKELKKDFLFELKEKRKNELLSSL